MLNMEVLDSMKIAMVEMQAGIVVVFVIAYVGVGVTPFSPLIRTYMLHCPWLQSQYCIFL